MGVQLLNTFLHKTAFDVTERVHMNDLRGKRVVIDAYIYIYRYAGKGNIIENIYSMCSIFRRYGIHAMFIFDGHNISTDKNNTLQKRRDDKVLSKIKYLKYENQLVDMVDGAGRDKLLADMVALKKRCIKITRADVDEVKTLLDAYGIMYRTADGEADELCASLVINKMAYACLSEDTDLFVYNCTRVLKYFSLIEHTAIMYNLTNIITNLGISFANFQVMCICSGTDYTRKHRSIFENYNLYLESDKAPDFKYWLIHNGYLTSEEQDNVDNECLRYNNTKNAMDSQPYFLIRNRAYNYINLHNVLSRHGFVFIG
jgi:hypothetical protein